MEQRIGDSGLTVSAQPGRLAVLGPYRGGSGYDHHTREFVREFVRQDVEVQLRELSGWSPPLAPDRQDPFFDRLSRPVAAQLDLQFAMPHQIAPTLGLPCVNYTMFECAQIPSGWVRQAARCALVVVPTRSSYQAWVASGVDPERLRIAPLGIDREFYQSLPSPLALTDASGRPVDSYSTRFLNVAELSPRKNLLGLLRSWLRATRATDDTILILKCNVWRDGLADLFQADLEDVVRSAGRTFDQAAPVLFVTDYLPDAVMPRLYRAATHYLSASFGEGWDLPMTEAAAAGLSLVAPRHSAYLDYLDDESVHWIPVRETAVDLSGRLAQADVALFDGMRWWTPDEDVLVAVLRDVVAGRATPKASPREQILDRFGWDTVSRRLLEVLADVLPQPARSPATTGGSPLRRRTPGGSMSDPYLDQARAAAQQLTKWFTPSLLHQWVPNEDYWKAPTIAQELVFHMALTGADEQRSLVDQVREAGVDYLENCGYLDDATVWGRFQVSAYEWITASGGSGADVYRSNAGTVFDGLVPTWDDVCGGGLYWMRPLGGESHNFKASNATLGLMEIGLGLHHVARNDTEREAGLEAARKAWAWIEPSGLIDTSGLVWGGLTSTCTVDPENQPVVALQGNPLTPLWRMYEVAGDPTLLDLAERIVDATMKDFVWPGTQTLRTPFDGDWARQDEDWRSAHQNDATFKGVFCGFLGQFTKNLATVPDRAATAARYAKFLRANADTLIANFPGGAFSMDWHTADPHYTGDPDVGNAAVLQYSGLAALDAAATVSML